MFILEHTDIYIPNTEALRHHIESLNYVVKPISNREHREIIKYKSICFSECIENFERVKQTNNMYYCMYAVTLTEDQSIFMLNILHICPDYETFKEALEGYINSNP